MTSECALEERLRRQLTAIEKLQLSAIDADPDALLALVKGLSEARVTTKRGIFEGSLTRRTLAFARSIAAAGKSLANHLLGVERINADVEAKRQHDIVAAMDRLSLEDVGSNVGGTTTAHGGSPYDKGVWNAKKRSKPSSSTSSSTTTRAKGHILHPSHTDVSHDPESSMRVCDKPSHVLQSSDWLLAHLHNPYPPASVKTRVATNAGVSVKTVEDWFTHTRKRIGWTSIVKKFFKGCRAEAIDCAMTVIAGEPTRRPIPSGTRDALLAMRTAAVSLLGCHHNVSDIARKIEATMKGCTANAVVDEDVTKTRLDLEAGATVVSSTVKDQNHDESRAWGRYTSKKRCLDANDDNSQQIPCQSTQLNKRRRCSRDPSYVMREPCVPRPNSIEKSTSSAFPSSIQANLSSSVAPLGSPINSRKRHCQESKEDELPMAKRHCNTGMQIRTSWCLDEKSSSCATLDFVSSGSPRMFTSSLTDFSFLGDVHFVKTSDEWNRALNSMTSTASDSSIGVKDDPLSTIRPEDFGEDFADFPGMPDLNIDWNSIPPPSLDSFLLPSEFSFSSPLLTPANCGSNVETQLSTSFGSDSTLADPSALSLSFLDKP